MNSLQPVLSPVIMCSALHALALALALSLALLQSSVAFVPIGGGEATHVSITRTALLQKLKETCQAVADSSGYEFNPTVGGKHRPTVTTTPILIPR